MLCRQDMKSENNCSSAVLRNQTRTSHYGHETNEHRFMEKTTTCCKHACNDLHEVETFPSTRRLRGRLPWGIGSRTQPLPLFHPGHRSRVWVKCNMLAVVRESVSFLAPNQKPGHTSGLVTMALEEAVSPALGMPCALCESSSMTG